MVEYIKSIILQYVEDKHKELKFSSDQPALAILTFSRVNKQTVLKLLEENNVLVSVPANCTNRLQPMDLSVNRSVKEFVRGRFRDWYSKQVQQQLSKGKEITPVNLKMSTMKPLSARWLISCL